MTFSFTRLLATLAVAATIASWGIRAEAQSTTSTWRGTVSTSATTAGNWSGVVPVFGGTNSSWRLDVANGTGNPLIYTSAEGATVFTSPGRAFAVGNTAAGSISIAGGTLSLASSTENLLGVGGNNGMLSIDGGTFLAGASALVFGFNSSSGTNTLTVNSGSANIPFLRNHNNVGTTSILNANGGTLVLTTVSSTFTGSIPTFNFNGGVVRAGTSSASFLSTVLTNVRNGGAIFDTAGNNITIVQSLRHSTIGGDAAIDGGLTKRGAGTLTLSASNSYTGATTISGGRLTLGSASSLGASGPVAVTSGTLDLNGRSVTIGALSGSAGGTITTGTAGAITLTSSAATPSTYEGVIADGSGSIAFTKLGTGALTLSGSSSYTGATTIAGGRLEIGSSGQINGTSGITINGVGAELKVNSATTLTKAITFAGSGGTLSGTGTIGSALTIGANAILAPGNSPGILTGTGGVSWNPGGTYDWELNAMSGTAGSNWDLLAVTAGGLNLSTLSTGSTFNLDLITLAGGNTAGPLDIGYVAGASYEFLIASYNTLTVPVGYSTAPNSDLTGLFTLDLSRWQGPQPSVSDISVKVNSSGDGISLVVVPEPEAIALATIGLAAVVCSAQRSRRRAS
jgi:autotransporter-associated beta strand protein